MKREQWETLKNGDVIHNLIDGYNKIKQYEHYEPKEKFMVSCDEYGNETGKGLFNLGMFDCEDWNMVIDGIIINE